MSVIAALAVALLAESPLSAADELKTFTAAPGFSVELVATEPDIAKPVAIAFDDAGRLWLTTDFEYPLDGNENPDAARRLFETGGRDRILVIDRPCDPGPHVPRVYADGLAMPMGILPVRDGLVLGHGPEILFLGDTDGDGRADEREVLLGGFGIDDSHLLPHGFTRGPGGWIYFAQGAFNRSRVRTREGPVVSFDLCKIGRFRADGHRFEVAAVGLNNVWGFDFDRSGAFFAQEANDLGYPVVPFRLSASWPGIGMDRMRPYAPFLPPLADFRMGGTGLSGLALASDRGTLPPEWDGVAFVANPIARKIQAIRIDREGSEFRLEKLADFLESTDEWFRPVALRFGPDGCLYVVDFYNKIISHNEVPRTHPERDKTRGRIWRVRWDGAPRRDVPDLTRLPAEDLLSRLASDSTWESRAAWHQIVDRKETALAPRLRALATSDGSADARLLALWSLEELRLADAATLRALASEPDPALRREAVRVLADGDFAESDVLAIASRVDVEEDPRVREEIARALGSIESPGPRALSRLASLAGAPLPGETVNPEGGGGPVLVGAASDRAFLRFLVRMNLERHSDATRALLDADAGHALPAEARLLAALACGAAAPAARALADLERDVSEDELLAAVSHAGDPVVGAALARVFALPAALETLLRLATRFDPEPIRPVLGRAAASSPIDLALRLGAAFGLRETEPLALEALGDPELALSAARALRAIGTARIDRLHAAAAAAPFGSALAREAALALAASDCPEAGKLLLDLLPDLDAEPRRAAAEALARTRAGARSLLGAVASGAIGAGEVSGAAWDRVRSQLAGDAEAEAILREHAPPLARVLRLEGGNDDYADADIDLSGPFTVEAWVRLDPEISNEVGILGRPGGADLNFAGKLFRVYGGPEHGDRVIARTPIRESAWTHVAATRDASGRFRIYLDGDLDADESRPLDAAFSALDVGRTTPGGAGTKGEIAEFRAWSVARSEDEIRGAFERAIERAPGLVVRFAGDGPWGRSLSGVARVESVLEGPPVRTDAELRARDLRFARARRLLAAGGDAGQGREVFEATCLTCHTVAAGGAGLAPSLSGASLRSDDALLRAILEPSVAVEPGYRKFVVTTRDERILDGFLAREDDGAIVLRTVEGEEIRIPRADVRRAGFTRASMMPDGLLDALPDADVAALFAYLRTL